jgi:hypothetical protein
MLKDSGLIFTSVYPSGFEFTTTEVPTTPPPPGLFTKTMVPLMFFARESETLRQKMSVRPPGLYGITIWTGLLGYSSAAAAPTHKKHTNVRKII